MSPVMLNKARLIALMVSLVSFAPQVQAGGGGGGAMGGCPLCATEITQIANNAQLAASYIQQAQQTVTQMQQYMTMLQNLQRYGPSALLGAAAKKLWSDANMNSTFKDLFSVVQSGTKLAYSMASLSNQLKTLQPPSLNGMNLSFDYAGAYKDWILTSRNTVDNSIKLAGAQADQFDSEEEMISELEKQAADAEGQMQALKAGADIGIAQINQLQMLRQLVIAQNQAVNTTQKAQEAQNNRSDEVLLKLNSGIGTKK